MQGALRFLARIVHARPFDHADQGGEFVQFQPVQWAIEVEMAGQPETVDGTIGVLAEIDFVEVGFENLILAVVHLQQQRHQHLGGLARERAFRGEEEILDQLLGERAAALDALSGHGLEQRARNATRIDAPVRVVLAILDGDERVDQRLGDLVEAQ